MGGKRAAGQSKRFNGSDRGFENRDGVGAEMVEGLVQ